MSEARATERRAVDHARDAELDRVTVYRDTAGEWRWRRQAGNNEPIAESSEGYVNKDFAIRMAKSLNPHVQMNHFTVEGS